MALLGVERVVDGVLPSSPGTYALILYCPRTRRVEVGKLGVFDIRRGWYGYVGSAFGPGGLKARCRHHRSRAARPHWHIDFMRTVASLRAIWFTPDTVPREHQWVEMFEGLPETSITIPRFGSGGCTCTSHLFRFPGRPVFANFRRMVQRRWPAHGPILALDAMLPRQAHGNAL